MDTRIMQAGFASLWVLFFVVAIPAQAQTVNSNGKVEADGSPETTEVDWALFSEQVVRALKSGHPGLQEGALRMIIRYGDRLDVRAGRFELVRLYRDSADDRLRQMAVVAIGRSEDPWAMDFLRRSIAFERESFVRQTITSVVYGYDLARDERDDAPSEVAAK